MEKVKLLGLLWWGDNGLGNGELWETMAPADDNVLYTCKNGRRRLASSLTGPPGTVAQIATRGQRGRERLKGEVTSADF